MFLRHSRCLDGWREFSGLLRAHVGRFVLYLLFHLVLSMGIGLAVFIATIFTCCIAGCLLAIPYLGTVLFLPVLVFLRAYSLHYLAQFGPQYIAWGAPPASAS
jgi:hypothetical protein